ncbi:MAG: MlaD family protein [Planctomycetia bacterium]|nr:MlaD family protein [Planctomycetia bacterium]
MNERTMQLRLGAAVLASLVIIGILLTFLGANNHFLGSHYTIYIHLDDAPGVVENTPIYQSGILIGRVQKVSLLEDEGVLVSARIFGDKTLYHDQQCSLSTSFLGDASLRISRVPQETGTSLEPAKKVEPGETLMGRIAFDPIVLANKMQERLSVAIDDVSHAAIQLEKVASSADRMMNDNRENIRSIIDNARSITGDSRAIVNKFSTLFDDEFARNMQESVTTLPETLKTMNDTFTSVENKVTVAVDKMNNTVDTVSRRVQKSLDLVDHTLQNVQKITDPIAVKAPVWLGNIDNILQNMDVFIENINNPTSTIGLLMRDRELYDNLSRTAWKVHDLVRQAEPIVFNAQVFSEKIAQHPELLGVRGALKPSSGTSRSIPWPKGITPPASVDYSWDSPCYEGTVYPERKTPAWTESVYSEPLSKNSPEVRFPKPASSVLATTAQKSSPKRVPLKAAGGNVTPEMLGMTTEEFQRSQIRILSDSPMSENNSTANSIPAALPPVIPGEVSLKKASPDSTLF